MVKLIEMACIENTKRIACQTINTPLHREEKTQSLKLRTMTDPCDRHGKEAEEYQERQTESVLESYGWNPETGLLKEGTPPPEGNPVAFKRKRTGAGRSDCVSDSRYQ